MMPGDDDIDWYALSNGLDGVFPDGTRFNNDPPPDPLGDAIEAANRADEAFQEAVEAAGFKSRWEVPAAAKLTNAGLKAAYDAKVAADLAVHEAFVASRARS